MPNTVPAHRSALRYVLLLAFILRLPGKPCCYNRPMKKQSGKIIIPSGVNVWPHEYQTAQSLADAGYVVEFIRKSDLPRERSADAFLDGEKHEFKAPKSAKLSAVEDNLKKASRQASNIVFDSRRMKRVPDKAIERELITQLEKSRVITRIVFINRHGIVIEIR